jgi:CYTH domain-containing protein
MIQTEIETTYLANSLPEAIKNAPGLPIIDTYFPAEAAHPHLRIRQKGDRYTLTKKTQVKPGDASTQTEENIELTKEEFEALGAGRGKTIAKIRYEVPLGKHTAEIDVFTGDLEGLVLVDVEFNSAEARDAFVTPDFCGADVTQEDFIAGGMLAGKRLEDIRADLERLNYTFTS